MAKEYARDLVPFITINSGDLIERGGEHLADSGSESGLSELPNEAFVVWSKVATHGVFTVDSVHETRKSAMQRAIALFLEENPYGWDADQLKKYADLKRGSSLGGSMPVLYHKDGNDSFLVCINAISGVDNSHLDSVHCVWAYYDEVDESDGDEVKEGYDGPDFCGYFLNAEEANEAAELFFEKHPFDHETGWEQSVSRIFEDGNVSLTFQGVKGVWKVENTSVPYYTMYQCSSFRSADALELSSAFSNHKMVNR
jgi:hypothetical protein